MGVTCLDDVLYIVCAWSSIIKTFTTDSNTFSPVGDGTQVEGLTNPLDIVVCRHDRQLYVADLNYCIWRVSADDHSDQEKWLTTESTTDRFSVYTLSVTSRRLLVTSRSSPGLREYSTADRQLLRVVQLPGYVKELYHSVETTRGTFVIGQQGTSQDEQQYAVSEQILNFITYHKPWTFSVRKGKFQLPHLQNFSFKV